MSTLPHITTNPASEVPSTSETSVGGHAGANLVQKESDEAVQPVSTSDQSNQVSQQKPKMSAEEAAEKLFEERTEDEYAKREGGA